MSPINSTSTCVAAVLNFLFCVGQRDARWLWKIVPSINLAVSKRPRLSTPGWLPGPWPIIKDHEGHRRSANTKRITEPVVPTDNGMTLNHKHHRVSYSTIGEIHLRIRRLTCNSLTSVIKFLPTSFSDAATSLESSNTCRVALLFSLTQV